MKALNLSGILKGCVLSVIISFLFILGLSAVSYFSSVGNTAVTIVIFAGVTTGVFLGAFAAGRGAERKRLVNGLAVGILYTAVLSVLSLIISGGGGFHARFLTLAAGCILAAAAGGIKSL